MEYVTKKITDVLVHNNIADEQQRTVITFGINSTINKMLHLSMAVFIGILFGRALEIIVFHIFYQKLRTYAGGHHANSNIVCFLCSCGIAFVTLTFWCLYPTEGQAWCTLTFLVISIPIIWILSPVGATTKPLDETEMLVYRKKARTILLIEVAGIVLLYLIGFKEIALVGTTALVVLAIMLLLGKAKG